MSLLYISPHFTWAEAMCHDGAEVPLELQANARHLAQHVLEPIREEYGGAIVVISWYRTPEYNTRIHGAPNSRHPRGDAADIRTVELGALPRLRTCIEEMITRGKLPALGGFGIYPNQWLHVDARPRPADGHIARWHGRGVGSEA